jgi:hypothetical protein
MSLNNPPRNVLLYITLKKAASLSILKFESGIGRKYYERTSTSENYHMLMVKTLIFILFVYSKENIIDFMILTID